MGNTTQSPTEQNSDGSYIYFNVVMAGVLSMSDEKPLDSEAVKQREKALSRWENEGGSGPPEKTASAGKLVFNASMPAPNPERRRRVTEIAAASSSGSQF